MIYLVLGLPILFAALVYGGRESFRSRRSVDLRRLAPLAGGAAVATAVGGLMLGGGSGGPERVSLPIAVLLAALTFLLLRQGPGVTEGTWGGHAAVSSPSTVAAPRTGPSPASAVATALGRVETRELSRSPWFGVGFGFSVLIFVLFGFVFVGEDTGTWDGQLQLSSWFAYPMVGMVVLAIHRAVTRAGRDGADELFDTCATTPTTRTAGFLLTALLPVTVIAVLLVALVFAVEANGNEMYGPIGADSVADIVVAIVLGAGGVALGVALGRWVRFGLAPVVTVVAIGFFGIQLNMIGGSGWNPLVPLSTAPALDGAPPMFGARPVWWHLLWILGLTAVVAVVGVARHRRDRPVVVAGALAVVVALVAGIGATRPLPPATAARMADVVANPEANQECVATGSVEVCVYPIFRGALAELADRIAPIAAVLPAGLGPIVLRQVYEESLDDLPPEVRRLLTEADLERPDGEVPVGFDGDLVDLAGTDLAYRAVGLPSEADENDLPVVVPGEARGVVALWLATRGLDHEAAAGELADAWTGSEEPEPCEVPAVVFSTQDLSGARAIVALAEADVAAVIAEDWERWIDPGTSTDELLTALGLDEVGPFDDVVARPGSPC